MDIYHEIEMVLLMSEQQRWHRRDAKKAQQKKFKSDNRSSVRTIINIIVDKAKKIKEKEKGSV